MRRNLSLTDCWPPARTQSKILPQPGIQSLVSPRVKQIISPGAAGTAREESKNAVHPDRDVALGTGAWPDRLGSEAHLDVTRTNRGGAGLCDVENLPIMNKLVRAFRVKQTLVEVYATKEEMGSAAAEHAAGLMTREHCAARRRADRGRHGTLPERGDRGAHCGARCGLAQGPGVPHG